MSPGPQAKTCQLCQAKAELQRSHIMPAWAYRRLGTTQGAGRSDPVTISHGKAWQTSKQLRAYLLCRDCERRISIHEDFVARGVVQEDGTSTLHAAPNVGEFRDQEGRPVNTVALDQVTASSLLYFAASVFWRASVSDLCPKMRLGARYDEAFRRFLLGAPFSPHADMMVYAFEPALTPLELLRIVAFPVTNRAKNGQYHWHHFAVLGLYFRTCVGQRRPTDFDPFSLSGAQPHLIKTTLDAIPFGRLVGQQIMSAEALGKLSKSGLW